MQPVTFSIDGTQLIYDYDLLVLAQMKIAEAVYEFQADLTRNPPRTLREKIELGADADMQVLSYILLRVKNDGSIEKYRGKETQQAILTLVNQMPSSEAEKIREVILDFFQRRERYTLALLVRSRFDQMWIEESMSRMLRIQASENSANSVEKSLSEPSETPHSTKQATVSEELGSA